MRRLIIVVILAVTGWQGYSKYQNYRMAHADEQVAFEPVIAEPAAPLERREHTPTQQFQCDGRTHCPQMTSCEEATFFLRNCPDTTMDGVTDEAGK